MYISIDELKTHLRDEFAQFISRGDDTLLIAALDGAQIEAIGYLSDYDVTDIFNKIEDDRNPLLLIFVKDIAVYHFINLCGGGVFYERREKRYEAAIAWLKGVQKGVIIPNLPKLVDINGNPQSVVHLSSNSKRGNHF